jgi:hypothetical protein
MLRRVGFHISLSLGFNEDALLWFPQWMQQSFRILSTAAFSSLRDAGRTGWPGNNLSRVVA